MATGGTPFVDSEEELHNWTVTNSSLDDRLNNTVSRLTLNVSMHTLSLSCCDLLSVLPSVNLY